MKVSNFGPNEHKEKNHFVFVRRPHSPHIILVDTDSTRHPIVCCFAFSPFNEIKLLIRGKIATWFGCDKIDSILARLLSNSKISNSNVNKFIFMRSIPCLYSHSRSKIKSSILGTCSIQFWHIRRSAMHEWIRMWGVVVIKRSIGTKKKRIESAHCSAILKEYE